MIEIKSKFPSENDNLHSIQVERIERKTKYQKAAQKASKQLNSSSSVCENFRLLWLDCGSESPDLHFQNYRYALFGIRLCQPLNNDKVKEGYYITHSDFFKYRDRIDGAAISCRGEVFFFANNYSQKFKEIINGALEKVLPKPFDLIEAEKKQELYLADFEIDRNNVIAIQEALSKKYGFEAMFLIPPSSLRTRVTI